MYSHLGPPVPDAQAAEHPGCHPRPGRHVLSAESLRAPGEARPRLTARQADPGQHPGHHQPRHLSPALCLQKSRIQ